MLSPMEPRCTGMCGALAIRLPSASKSAQEKSSRSLMLTEYAVCARRTPICSAIDMKRLLNTSSITGSARRAERVARLALGTTRSSTRWSWLGDARLPLGLDDGGGVALGDDRGAGDALRRARASRGCRPACRGRCRRRSSVPCCNRALGPGRFARRGRRGSDARRGIRVGLARPPPPTPPRRPARGPA